MGDCDPRQWPADAGDLRWEEGHRRFEPCPQTRTSTPICKSSVCVSALASKAGFNNGAITTLQNPLIVNGLQTSYEVNRWARSGGTDSNRLLMVRIIETTDEDVINSVIKATNYQTKVKPRSPRATEEIHRQIEILLFPQNVFYDRRRNYYKNLNKPASRTIGIDRMSNGYAAGEAGCRARQAH